MNTVLSSFRVTQTNLVYCENVPAVMEKKSRQLTPEQDALEHILACRDKHFLKERVVDSFKGKYISDGRQ